jgi:hypothetical protein
MTTPERNSNSGGPPFKDDAAYDDPHDSWTSMGLTVWIAKVRESSRNDERNGVKSAVKAIRPGKSRKTAA